MTEKDLAELQNIPVEERIKRIEKLLDGKESPRAFELGLLLALKMGQEIRDKKPWEANLPNSSPAGAGNIPSPS